MPNVDLTITVSVILAVCALISPAITALINNSHQRKMKKLELRQASIEKHYTYTREIFENYLKHTNEYLLFPRGSNQTEYLRIYPLALMYFPDDLHADLIKLNSFIEKDDFESAQDIFHDFAPMICKSARKLLG